MTDRVKPVALAKQLNIRPQIVYGLIKRGKIRVFDNPDGGPQLVDADETRIIISRMHVRGPHKEKRVTSGRPPKGISRGTIISHASFPTQGPYARPNGGPQRIWQITDPGMGDKTVTWGSDGIRGLVWSTASLADRLKAETAKIEHVDALLGMIMFQWREDGAEEISAALEKWCTDNGVLFKHLTHEETHEHVDPDEPVVADEEE